MSPWKIEILQIGQLHPFHVPTIDFQEEKVGVGVGCYEHGDNSKKEKNGQYYTPNMIEKKGICADARRYIYVDREVLCNDPCDKWNGKDKSANVCIQEEEYFWNVPVDEVAIGKSDVAADSF